MTLKEFLAAVLSVSWSVLDTLASSLSPRNMQEICARHGLPPIALGEDWSEEVAQVRIDIASGLLGDAEEWARVVYVADLLADRVYVGLNAASATDVLAWLRPFVLHALLSLVTRRDRSGLADFIVWTSAGLLLMDVRVQESFLGGAPVHRAEQGIWPLLEQYGTDEVKAAAALAGATLLFDWLVRDERDKPWFSPFRLRCGFDVPAHEPPPSGGDLVGPLAVARESARWTFAVEYNLANIALAATRYDAFDLPAPVVAPFATGIRFTFVPVPAASRFDANDTSRPAMIHISLGGDVAETQHFGDSTLSVSVSGDAGILLPVPRMTWDWPWNWDWTPPGSFSEVTGGVEMAFQYATARRARADADPSGVSITVDRFVTEGRISATGAIGSGPGSTGSRGVASARIDLEGVTLTIGPVSVLDFLLKNGASVTFDAGIMATYTLGGALEVGFHGAAGFELVVPIQGEVSKWGLRAGARQVRLKARAGRADDNPDSPHQFVVEATGDFLIGFRAWTVSIDGIGGSFAAGATNEPNGNVAGVVDVGLNLVCPSRIGLTVECPSFHGGGFLDHDAESDRWSGGGEFVALNGKLSVRALFLCEPSLTAGERSWIALGTLEWPSPAWFIPKGVGILLASNRTTNPSALLAAVAAGDLEAILFPSDVATRGAAYIATLGRLLPAAADGCVRAIFLTFSGLGGKVRADLGVMYDAGASERAYLLARLRIAMPTVDDPLARIEIAALGVWDRARDEYELRAALINSHIFGGELTGEALMFSGRANPGDRNSGRVFLVSIGGFHPKYVVPGPAIQVPARVSLLVQRGDHLRLECQAYLAITQGTLQLGLESSLAARFAGFGIRGNLGFDALINTSLEFLLSVRVGVALYLGSRMLLGASLEGEIGLVGEGNAAQAYLRGRARISFWFFDYETPRFTIPLIVIRREWSLSRDPADSLYDAIMENANWDNGGTPGVLVRPPVDRSDWRVSPSAPLRFTQALVPLDVPITHFDSVALPQARTLAIEVDRPVGATWTTAAVEEEFAPMMFFSMTPEEKLAVRGFEYLPGGVELARPLTAGVAIDLGLECEELVIDRSNPPEAPRSIVLENEIAVLGRDLGPHRSNFQQVPTRQPASLRAEQFAVLDARGDVVAIDRSFTAAFGHARGQLGHEVVPMREVA